MVPRTWLPFLLWTGMVTACTDRVEAPADPTGPSVQASAAVGHAGTAPEAARRRGRGIQVRIDRSNRTVQLATGASEVDYCEAGAEACEPFCASYSGECTTVDEPLDEGSRAFVGNTTGDEEVVVQCPAMFSGGTYLSWRGNRFLIFGTFIRQGQLRSWPWAEAEYALPPGPHESLDGRAVIWSGVAKGKCWGRYGPNGYEGVIAMSWLRGDAREVGSGGGGGDAWGGEETYTVSDGNSTWVSNGKVHTGDATVDQVVNDWIATGQCTEGWVIIVDGIRVC